MPEPHAARPQEARPEHARRQGALGDERAQARAAGARVRAAAGGEPGRVGRASGRSARRARAAWTRFEEKLVTAAGRGDVEGDPRRPGRVRRAGRDPAAGRGRSHGGDLQEPRHAASLSTAIRYQTAAGMAVTAGAAGVPRPPQGQEGRAGARDRASACRCRPSPPTRIDAPGAGRRTRAGGDRRTNELPPGTANPSRPTTPRPRRVADRERRARRRRAWLATLPVVEADPEREAERRELLLQVEPAILRRAIGHAPLAGIENYLLCPTWPPTRSGSRASPSRRARRRRA